MCNCKRNRFKEIERLQNEQKTSIGHFLGETKVRNNADLQGLHRIKVWVDEKYQDLSEILDKFEDEKCENEDFSRQNTHKTLFDRAIEVHIEDVHDRVKAERIKELNCGCSGE